MNLVPVINLPLGIIPLAVDHRINHKYLKLLNIPILNMAYTSQDQPYLEC